MERHNLSFDRRNGRLSGRECSAWEAKLGIDWAEIACRTHEYSIGSEHEQGSGAFRLVRNDDGKLLASGLRLADESKRRFSVSTERAQHDVKVLVRVCVVERLLE